MRRRPSRLRVTGSLEPRSTIAPAAAPGRGGRAASRAGGSTTDDPFRFFNPGGIQPARRDARRSSAEPDIAIQLDLMLATDTPDMQARGDLALGGGPGMSLYSFHGRGTLNGTIRIPRSSRFLNTLRSKWVCRYSAALKSACSPTSSYVQLVHHGVAAIDLGFPCRYSHSALEVCDLSDLVGLARRSCRWNVEH